MASEPIHPPRSPETREPFVTSAQRSAAAPASAACGAEQACPENDSTAARATRLRGGARCASSAREEPCYSELETASTSSRKRHSDCHCSVAPRQVAASCGPCFGTSAARLPESAAWL